MKWTEYWQMSLRNILSAPLRSVLTMLGMAIGIGAVLAVITLGDAGQQQVRGEMGRLGIDRVWITAGEDAQLLRGDGQLLAELTGSRAAEQAYLPVWISAGENQQQGTAAGITRDYLDMCGLKLVAGRMLYPSEWHENSRVVLIGEELAEKLGIQVGEWVRMAGRTGEVAGIVTSGEGVTGVSVENSLFLPLECLQEICGQQIHEIMLSVPSDAQVAGVAQQAASAMALYRNTDVQATTMQLQIDAADSVLETFVRVLGWVAVICILVGGIGIMNILLVGVRERSREIGIMKSLGTTRRQICLLFLSEALIYAVVGGAAGLALGIVLTTAAGANIGVCASVRAADCAAVFGAGLATGLFFGVAPAFGAACLHPVDALHRE